MIIVYAWVLFNNIESLVRIDEGDQELFTVSWGSISSVFLEFPEKNSI